MPTKAILHRHRQASHLALVAQTHRQEVAAELDRINAPLSRVSGVHVDFADVQRLQAFYVAFYFRETSHPRNVAPTCREGTRWPLSSAGFCYLRSAKALKFACRCLG